MESKSDNFDFQATPPDKIAKEQLLQPVSSEQSYSQTQIGMSNPVTGPEMMTSSSSPMVSPEMGRVKRLKWGWIVAAVVVIALVIVGICWHFGVWKSATSNSTGKIYTVEDLVRNPFNEHSKVVSHENLIPIIEKIKSSSFAEAKQELSWLQAITAAGSFNKIVLLAKPGVNMEDNVVQLWQKGKCPGPNSEELLQCYKIWNPERQKSTSGREYVVYDFEPRRGPAYTKLYFMQVDNLGFVFYGGRKDDGYDDPDDVIDAEQFEKEVEQFLHKLNK